MKATKKISHFRRNTIGVIAEILKGLNTESSLRLCGLLEKDDHTAFLTAIGEFTPHSWAVGPHCWRTFFREYQAVELASKFDGLVLPGVDRKAVAMSKFLESEESCRAINSKLWRLMSGASIPLDTWQVLNLARQNISKCLGDFCWDETVPFMAFGPGASIGLPRKRRHRWYKIGFRNPTVTGECATLASQLFSWFPQWRLKAEVPTASSELETSSMVRPDLSIVSGSRITTVPKNAKTDRVIAIEPLMNMYVQKGIGGVIRRRLKRVQVDLDSQTRNQELAKAGSLTGRLATIDLSMASDSVSCALVDMLLPGDWVTAMKMCRSNYSVLPSGETVFLQKFSSMGNGYTFELESLIFWALAKACCHLQDESERDLSVYGDDIIVPVSVVASLIDSLAYVGFKTNVSKSYWEGPFRESCGKHYFLGHDVTPIYIRKDIDRPERKLWAANSIRRLAYRMVGYNYGCDERLRRSYDYVCRTIPRYLAKLSIPEGFGDGGLVRDFDTARPVRHRYFDAYIVRHMVRRYHTFIPYDQPALFMSLSDLDRKHNKRTALRPVPPKLLFKQRRLHVGLVEESIDAVAWELRSADTLFKGGPRIMFLVQRERYSDALVKGITPQWAELGPWLSGY